MTSKMWIIPPATWKANPAIQKMKRRIAIVSSIFCNRMSLYSWSFQPEGARRRQTCDARLAATKILEQSLHPKRKGYIYVNNRLEGCAPLMIEGFLPRNL